MKVIGTGLPGCLVVEQRVFHDTRGYFLESWNRQRYAEHGIDVEFVKSNVSRSSRGVLRGLHYQWPNPQGKLVSVLDGEIYDAIVDIRRGSPTFGHWTGVVLSSDNNRQLWIPEGFAHGFAVLSDSATVTYLCTTPYDAQADAAIRWDDPDIAVDWPVSAPLVSTKDAAAPLLAAVAPDRLPTCASC